MCSSYSVTMEESTICDLPSQVRCILIAMGKLYSVLFSIAFFFKFHYFHVIFYITESAAGVNVYLYVYAYNWKYRWVCINSLCLTKLDTHKICVHKWSRIIFFALSLCLVICIICTNLML